MFTRPDPELGHLIIETDTQAIQYAAKCLALATVDVSVQDCDYLFNSLPVELQEPFAEIGHPTKQVSRLDMQLTYNRADAFFMPREVGLLLDNGLRMTFSRMRNLSGIEVDEKSRRWGVFYPNIWTRDGRSLVKQEKTRPVSAGLLHEMLKEIGIELPTAPQRADWEAIQSMLHFSDRWSATTKQSTQIDPITSLYVEERLDGRGLAADTGSADELPEKAEDLDAAIPTMRELIIALDTSRSVAQNPTRTVKYLLRSEDDEGQPRFAGVQSVPLIFEPDYLGENDTLRIERQEKIKFVMPNPPMLRKFQAAIKQARLMSDPFPA